MEEASYSFLEMLIQLLIDSGLLSALGDEASNMISQIFIEVGNWAIAMFWELIKTSAIFLVGVIISLVVAVLVVIAGIAIYVLHAIGLMRMAKKLGVGHRWLAWIPYGREFLTGACAEKCIERNGKKPAKWSAILFLGYLATTIGKYIIQIVIMTVLSVLPGLNALLTLAFELLPFIFIGLYAYCIWRLFKEFVGSSGSTITTIAMILTVWFEGLFFFIASCFKLRGSEDEQQTESAEVAELVEATAPVQNTEAYEDPFAV
jgi:hypothetical protein